jgi:hydrogenase expression/formation protein HypC
MYLGIPGRIEEIYSKCSPKMGRVNFGGSIEEVCFDYVPEAQTGQYVLTHVGFAIGVLDEEDAQARLQIIREINALENELNTYNER